MATGIVLKNCGTVVIRGGVIANCETAIDAEGVQSFDVKGLTIQSDAASKSRRSGILSGAANFAILGAFPKDLL